MLACQNMLQYMKFLLCSHSWDSCSCKGISMKQNTLCKYCGICCCFVYYLIQNLKLCSLTRLGLFLICS